MPGNKKVDTVNGIGCSVIHEVLGFVDEIAHILQLHTFAPARSSYAYIHKGTLGAVTIFYAEGKCYVIQGEHIGIFAGPVEFMVAVDYGDNLVFVGQKMVFPPRFLFVWPHGLRVHI